MRSIRDVTDRRFGSGNYPTSINRRAMLCDGGGGGTGVFGLITDVSATEPFGNQETCNERI